MYFDKLINGVYIYTSIIISEVFKCLNHFIQFGATGLANTLAYVKLYILLP